MRRTHLLASSSVLTLVAVCAAATASQAAVPPTAEHPWRAIHFICYHDDAGLAKLEEQLPQLAAAGINCIILEVNYNFDYRVASRAAQRRAANYQGRCGSPGRGLPAKRH